MEVCMILKIIIRSDSSIWSLLHSMCKYAHVSDEWDPALQWSQNGAELVRCGSKAHREDLWNQK